MMLHGRFSDSTRQLHDTAVLRGPRVVRDAESGESISVVERRALGVAGARGPASLFFSTERGFTRVWDYPANWDDLPDAELLALAERPRRSRSA